MIIPSYSGIVGISEELNGDIMGYTLMVATRVAENPYKWRLECEKHGRNCWFSSQPCLMTPEGLTYRWNQYVPHCPTTNLSENCYPTNISIHIQHKTCPNVAQCSWRYKWSNIGNDSWHLMMFIVTVCSIPLISNKYQVDPHEFRGISQETYLHVLRLWCMVKLVVEFWLCLVVPHLPSEGC